MSSLRSQTTEIVQDKVFGNVCCEKIGGTIFRIYFASIVFEIGQEVRFAREGCRIPVGTIGHIIKIHLPYENGNTSDVIDVVFENYGVERSIKPSEIR